MFVAGFTYGTSHPKIKPETVPQKGPSNGAVRHENMIPDNVITAGVPKIGYVGISASANIKAVHTPVKAKNTGLVAYFLVNAVHSLNVIFFIAV
jgi:hypothetical protein